MELKTRTDKIRKILRTIYSDVKTPLIHQTPFQLLIATILSAQCTDKQVNRVTEVLFKRLKTPADFAGAALKTIEKFIWRIWSNFPVWGARRPMWCWGQLSIHRAWWWTPMLPGFPGDWD
jgi:hypothetical protein